MFYLQMNQLFLFTKAIVSLLSLSEILKSTSKEPIDDIRVAKFINQLHSFN